MTTEPHIRSLIRPHKLWPAEVQREAMVGDVVYEIARGKASRALWLGSLRPGDVAEVHWLFLLADYDGSTARADDLLLTIDYLRQLGVPYIRESATGRTTEDMAEHMLRVALAMIRNRGYRPRWDYPPTVMGRPPKLTPEQKDIARIVWFDRRLVRKADVVARLAELGMDVSASMLFRLFGKRN